MTTFISVPPADFHKTVHNKAAVEDDNNDDFLYMVDEPEVLSFVQKMPNANAVRAAIDTRFFQEVIDKPSQTLYAVKDTSEGFVCKVYTHEDSNFVVQYIRGLDTRRLTG
jgi:hypothetical protein